MKGDKSGIQHVSKIPIAQLKNEFWNAGSIIR